ncbi:MAG: hypothetical protein KDE52_01075 [Calditrichaeota bacterium]|nr:hypothetical protein [Calditrichota bacterium]
MWNTNPVDRFTTENFLKLLMLLLCSVFIFHDVKADTPTSGAPSMTKAENYFFKLDFLKNSYEIADIENLFFTTFPHDDPTVGDVVYDRKMWQNDDMLRLENGDGLYLFIKERSDDVLFDSFRMTSKAFYNLNDENQRVLFVFKGKMPSVNGVWPAWWLNGSRQPEWTYQHSGQIATDAELDGYSGKGHFYDTPSAVNSTDWPAAGELDIIETINGENIIHNTLHTCPQMCDARWNDDPEISNCANAKNGDPNAGCSGKPYKVDAVEGTFACIWEQQTIRFYYWTPAEDVRKSGGPLSENPQPEQWNGENLKNTVYLLETDATCDNEAHQEWQCNSCSESNTCSFVNMKMIFNITLCGKWAGAKFDESDTPVKNCQSYISGEGRENIHNEFIKIEYVGVFNLNE